MPDMRESGVRRCQTKWMASSTIQVRYAGMRARLSEPGGNSLLWVRESCPDGESEASNRGEHHVQLPGTLEGLPASGIHRRSRGKGRRSHSGPGGCQVTSSGVLVGASGGQPRIGSGTNTPAAIIEICFSVVQRKVLTPNDFTDPGHWHRPPNQHGLYGTRTLG